VRKTISLSLLSKPIVAFPRHEHSQSSRLNDSASRHINRPSEVHLARALFAIADLETLASIGPLQRQYRGTVASNALRPSLSNWVSALGGVKSIVHGSCEWDARIHL